MAIPCSSKDTALIDSFKTILSAEPAPLVLRCKKCHKLRETKVFTDPLLTLQKFDCSEMGTSCDLPETVSADAQESKPDYVPGSFVLVTKDEKHYLPGMIDFLPELHPLYLLMKPTSLGGRAVETYYVSLLSDRNERFASDYFYISQISPLEASHSPVMRSKEALRKFHQCMTMQREDLRSRLYKFSYMAHKYNLEGPAKPARHAAFERRRYSC